MATFVLVPGGWHGGWWFRPLARRLRDHGSEVHTVTLTGVGDRRHLASAAVNLDTHVEDLVSIFEYEQLTDVVLCAHSHGGVVVAGALDRIADRVAALVLLDAQVPRDGESLWTLTTEAARAMLIEQTLDGYSVSPPPGLDSRTTPHPLGSFMQPVRLSGGLDRVGRKIYVYMSGWPDSPLAAMYERVCDQPGWEAHVWPGGHDVIDESLGETTELLLAEGARVDAIHDGAGISAGSGRCTPPARSRRPPWGDAADPGTPRDC